MDVPVSHGKLCVGHVWSGNHNVLKVSGVRWKLTPLSQGDNIDVCQVCVVMYNGRCRGGCLF